MADRFGREPEKYEGKPETPVKTKKVDAPTDGPTGNWQTDKSVDPKTAKAAPAITKATKATEQK